MKVSDIIELGLIKDDTKLLIDDICKTGTRAIARGNWFQDNILEYADREISIFTWSGDVVSIVLK